MPPTSPDQPRPDARLEDLGLSVRTRNALRGVGCATIADVLRLDLETPVRGLGRVARQELLARLQLAGLPHPSDAQPASEITQLERDLERIEQRVDSALGAVSKELRSARQHLRKLKLRAPQPSA